MEPTLRKLGLPVKLVKVRLFRRHGRAARALRRRSPPVAHHCHFHCHVRHWGEGGSEHHSGCLSVRVSMLE